MKFIKRSSVLFLALLLLTACSTHAVTWQEQYDLGMRCLSAGSYKEAIIAFTAAIEIEPNRASAYVSRGDAYVGYAQLLAADDPESEEAYESAVQDYLTAIDLDGSAVSVYKKAADVRIVLGDAESAAAILERGFQATGDLSLQAALDGLGGVIVPEALARGSERWTALETFLSHFGWYGDYDCETAAMRTGGEWPGPQNTLEKMLTVASCYAYNDALYPGEERRDCWEEPDPLGKWVYDGSPYMKVNAAKLEWILRYIFNCSPADIETMRGPILAGEDEYIYYLDGYYYFWIGGVGGGYSASITKVERRGARYYVEYSLDSAYWMGGTTPKCAMVSLKELDGREYWTLYSTRALEDSEMDWRGQYRRFVYNESYLQYGGPYNEGGDWGTDYNPITFSLRDIGGDGIPELIVYNGCDYEAGAFYNVFTSEPAGVRYVGTAGFRIGAFTYRDNPGYQGLFYQNGNMGYYPGYYYYMEDGTLIGEWVLTEEESYVNGEFAGFVTTQVTSDDALFSEFQNGNGHVLAAYTLEEIYEMGWDAFARETGGQKWS